MNHRHDIDRFKQFAIGFLIIWLCCSFSTVLADDAPKEKNDEKKIDYQAVTAVNPKIPKEELKLLLLPLTDKELEIEAEAWLKVLQNKVYETSQVELSVQRKRHGETQDTSTKVEQTQAPIAQKPVAPPRKLRRKTCRTFANTSTHRCTKHTTKTQRHKP